MSAFLRLGRRAELHSVPLVEMEPLLGHSQHRMIRGRNVDMIRAPEASHLSHLVVLDDVLPKTADWHTYGQK